MAMEEVRRGLVQSNPMLLIRTPKQARRLPKAITVEQVDKAVRFKDFRVMLDKMGKQIDAVIVCTPDHTHAVVTAAAIRAGKHVYCEKPLTHNVFEARMVAEATRKAGVAT